MPAKRLELGPHRDYKGSLEDINGLPPAEDQLLTKDELKEIEDTAENHADLLDQVGRPDLQTMKFTLDRL